MKIPWPQASASWNEIALGGVVLPGLANVSVRVGNELDKKKPKGKTGAAVTFQGRNAATVRITLRFWDEEEFQTFQELKPSFWPDAAKEQGLPVEIVHPRTRLWGIRAIYIDSIDDTQPDDGGDLYTIKMECTQWLPETKTKKAGSGAATTTANTLDPRQQSLAPPLNGGTRTFTEVPSKSGAARP